ncbi:Metacaspase-1, partial [Leucoagaricus sp. SymC.cos]
SYPGNNTYMGMPSMLTPAPTLYYPRQQLPAPEVIPHGQYQAVAPQVIILKHSHRRHGRHRAHSHSHSQPIVIPQPVTYSNSHPPYYSSPDTLDLPRPQHHPSSHHYSNESMGHIAVPPQLHYSSPQVSAATPTPRLDSNFKYSRCSGRKKALCIGINYRGQNHELRGCINDARNVRRWLINHHGFRNEDIVLLTDDTTEPRHLPTRQNMIDAMKWLVRSARTHDSLFFHYSGHGGQVEDQDGDEVDGFDETIFPLDFQQAGHIVDDELHEIMVSRLPIGCRLTVQTPTNALYLQSCHSGTVLDLPYIYSSHGRLKGEHIRGPARKRKETRADVISWSGCKDGQTSADTFRDGVAVGAMSNVMVISSFLTTRELTFYCTGIYNISQ